MSFSVTLRWRWWVLCALFVVLPNLPLAADPASALPVHWVDRVQPLPEVDISGAEVSARHNLEAARTELARRLADTEAETEAVGDAYGNLGALYQVHEMIAPAELCYLNAVALDPEVFRWRYYLAELWLGSGRARDALEQLEQTRTLDPDYAPLRLKTGRANYELNRWQEAEKEFRAVLDRPGLAPVAHYYLGQIALLQRDFRAAVGHFEQTLALQPDGDSVHYPLARALRALGEEERAREHLARKGWRLPHPQDPLLAELKALDGGARPHYLRGVGLVKRGEYAAAAAAFAAGLALDPDNANARISHARALYLAGQPEAARQELEWALTLAPAHALGRFLLGLLFDEAGKGERAAELYRAALALEPQHAGAHYFLAGQLFRAGDFSAAAEHYGAALQANPDISLGRLLQLVARQRAGASERTTLEGLEALLERNPGDPAVTYALIRLLAAGDALVRDPPRALELARELVELMPAPPHLAALALAHAANGDFAQALTVQQQLAFVPPWLGGISQARSGSALQDYEARRLPAAAWPEDDPLLGPPPVRAGGPIREYPAAVPY